MIVLNLNAGTVKRSELGILLLIIIHAFLLDVTVSIVKKRSKKEKT